MFWDYFNESQKVSMNNSPVVSINSEEGVLREPKSQPTEQVATQTQEVVEKQMQLMNTLISY